MPRPRLLTRKWVWWLLSNLLVVLTQQYWFWMNVDYMLAWCKAYFIGLCASLDDVVLFHWIVHNQDCWLSTSKKLLNSHQTLFLVRGWGLDTRLANWGPSHINTIPERVQSFLILVTRWSTMEQLMGYQKTLNLQIKFIAWSCGIIWLIQQVHNFGIRQSVLRRKGHKYPGLDQPNTLCPLQVQTIHI